MGMKRNKLSFLLGIALLATIALTECKKDAPVPATMQNGATSLGTANTTGSGNASANSLPPSMMP